MTATNDRPFSPRTGIGLDGSRGSLQVVAKSGSERSAAWLAHQSGGLGVGSSNLPAPTNKINTLDDLDFYKFSSGVPVGFPHDTAYTGR